MHDIGHERCIDITDRDLRGKVVVIAPNKQMWEHQTADRQIAIAVGGFGIYADNIGGSILCQFVSDGHEKWFGRHEILGELKPEYVPKWAAGKIPVLLQELEPKIQAMDQRRQHSLHNSKEKDESDER